MGHEGALARAGGSEYRDNLSRLDAEVEAPQGDGLGGA